MCQIRPVCIECMQLCKFLFVSTVMPLRHMIKKQEILFFRFTLLSCYFYFLLSSDLPTMYALSSCPNILSSFRPSSVPFVYSSSFATFLLSQCLPDVCFSFTFYLLLFITVPSQIYKFVAINHRLSKFPKHSVTQT